MLWQSRINGDAAALGFRAAPRETSAIRLVRQNDAGGPGPPAAQVPPCFDVYRRRSCSPPRSIITAATLRQTATPHTSVNNEIHMASLSDFLRPPLERRKQLPKA